MATSVIRSPRPSRGVVLLYVGFLIACLILAGIAGSRWAQPARAGQRVVAQDVYVLQPSAGFTGLDRTAYAVIDDVTGSSWHTPTLRYGDLGHTLVGGWGLIIDYSSPRLVSSLEIYTQGNPVDFTVYAPVSDRVSPLTWVSSQWTPLAKVEDGRSLEVVRFPQVESRMLLVVFTKVGPADGGGYGMSIEEIRSFG